MGRKSHFLSPAVDSMVMAGQEEIWAWTIGSERYGPGCDGHWVPREPTTRGVSPGQHSSSTREKDNCGAGQVMGARRLLLGPATLPIRSASLLQSHHIHSFTQSISQGIKHRFSSHQHILALLPSTSPESATSYLLQPVTVLQAN